jgi:hypothetical protein
MSIFQGKKDDVFFEDPSYDPLKDPSHDPLEDPP